MADVRALLLKQSSVHTSVPSVTSVLTRRPLGTSRDLLHRKPLSPYSLNSRISVSSTWNCRVSSDSGSMQSSTVQLLTMTRSFSR